MIRSDPDIEIMRIEFRRVKDMRRFVFDLYACDTVPINHLHSKLRYLFEVPPHILIVFARNYAPEECPVGEGPFRKVQCRHICKLKWEIREKYNPRREGQRTEEHIIHASDYEEQVDYFLKMLGYTGGIAFLHGEGNGLPFDLPYHLKRPHTYILRTVRFDDLRASVLVDAGHNRTPGKEIRRIEDTPHFRSLHEGTDDYVRYLRSFRFHWLTDDHYPAKLSELDSLAEDHIRGFPPLLVIRSDKAFRILDGVHRAAVALNHGLNDLRCVEFIY
jgi:hypothetical protein